MLTHPHEQENAVGTRDPRVDAYIARSADFAKPILKHLRELVHRACPEVQETMKWSFPHFDYKGMLCDMAAFKAHCSLGFWKASLLKKRIAIDVRTGKRKDGMGNFGRICSLRDLPSDATLVELIKQAAELNEQGIKQARPKPQKKKPVRIPADLAAALNKNARARAAFDAFSPSHKREYIDWISEAKSDDTRQRRLETALEWIAHGKHRHWKYER